ncbi:MAG: hypothetical protein ACK4K0_00860 [Flavobacteriales bacterium]
MVFAFLLRLLLLVLVAFINPEGIYTFDGHEYTHMADLIRKGWICNPNADEISVYDLHRTPLYPLLIYLTQWGSVYLLLALQLLAGVAVVYYTYKLTMQYVSVNWAKTAALFVAVDLPSIVHGNFVLTETFFTLTLIVALYCLTLWWNQQNKKALVMGLVLLGLASLFRPISLYLPFFIAFVLLFVNIRQTLVFFSCTLVVYLPIVGLWILRNYLIFGSIYYSHIGTFNLMYHQASSVYAQAHDIPIMQARNIVFGKALANSNNEFEFYSEGRKISLGILVDYPLITTKNVAKAEMNLFLKPVKTAVKDQFGTVPKSIEYLHLSVQFILLTPLYLGIALWKKSVFISKSNRFSTMALPVGVILYFMLTSNIPEVDARFRVPFIALLALISVMGYSNLLSKKNHKTKSK